MMSSAGAAPSCFEETGGAPLTEAPVPDSLAETPTLPQVTHLAIAADPFDLSFLSALGIRECLQKPKQHFAGVICSDSFGDPRSNELILKKHKRWERKIEDSVAMDGYAFVAPLRYNDLAISGLMHSLLVEDLVWIIQSCQPEVIYTHSPIDQRLNRIRVLVAVMEALQRVSDGVRPRALWGCEIEHDFGVAAHAEFSFAPEMGCADLANKTTGMFKRLAAGRTTGDFNTAKNPALRNERAESESIFAIDLSPVIGQHPSEIVRFTADCIDKLRDDVLLRLYETVS